MGVDADPGPRPGPGRRRMARKRRKRYHPPGTQPGTLVAHAEAQGTPGRVRGFRYDAGRGARGESRHRDPAEQVSFFLGDRVVVSFQERPGDCFDPVRDRLRLGKGRIRSEGADFLLYALCDLVLDAFFPTLEKLGDEGEEMEERVLISPVPETFLAIRRLKRDLLAVRHAVWPARDALNLLLIEEHALIRPGTKVFFRDCYDHTIQLMDMVETFREMASGLVADGRYAL